MAIWTEADIEAVEQSIRELQTGKRIVQLRLSDNTNVQKQQSDIPQLYKLRSLMMAEVQSSQGRPRSRVISTSKGLYYRISRPSYWNPEA